ncbi:MAG TPA: MFS transporter [Gemmatimonadaceae bacterium]|nr:MFS transporter [Gemmatimonadaceae bacterium]
MGTSLNPFRALRHRNFLLFWSGQTLSLIGTWMQAMAEGWLAFALTRNAFLVGLVAAAQSLPILLLSLYAGVLVDRANKLRLVTACQMLFAIQSTSLWLLAWTNHITIHWLIAMATFNGMISSVEIPARQSLVIELVGRDELPGAIALNSSGFNLARVIGPAAAAIVIAKLGIAWCFGVNAISYIAVLIGLFLIQLPAWVPAQHRASPLQGIVEGVRYMRGTPSVAAIIGIVTVYAVFGVPYLTLMPVVAGDRLGVGASGYGLLLACVGVGGLAGALTLAAFGSRLRREVVLSRASYSFASLLIIFAFVRVAWLAYPLLLLIGFAMIVNSAQANAMLQHLVPDELRGRIMAAYSFIVVGLSQVAGSFVAGAVARAFGVAWAIGGGGALMLIYALWAFRSSNAQPGEPDQSSIFLERPTMRSAAPSNPSQPVSTHM